MFCICCAITSLWKRASTNKQVIANKVCAYTLTHKNTGLLCFFFPAGWLNLFH
uniref:Uncharacterized protein n=1 Tax=Anguilla anguilla TaxID=7936 RepID=A0A0E9RCI0_ANGAN